MSDKDSITVVNLSSYAFTKRRDEPEVEKDGIAKYTITFYNNSVDEVLDFKLLDVLPYNGDNRGSKFNGTYTLDHIDIKGNEDQEEFKVAITENEKLRDEGIDANTENLQELAEWKNVQMKGINSSATAILISGNLKGETIITIDIYLQTKGNEPLDIYVNNATAMTKTLKVPLKTTNEEIVVIDRQIKGMVWFDENKNGLKDAEEKYLEDVAINLVTEEGEEVTDVFGKTVEEIRTDSNGNYRFTNLKKGKYKVRITIEDIFEITKKGVEGRVRINSKFDPLLKETDIINLEKINDTVILEDYVNAGLISDIYAPEKEIVNAQKSVITKTGEKIAKEGEILKYQIELENEGVLGKTVNVKDQIPEGTEFVEGSIKIDGVTQSYGKEDLEVNGINIELGKSIEFNEDSSLLSVKTYPESQLLEVENLIGGTYSSATENKKKFTLFNSIDSSSDAIRGGNYTYHVAGESKWSNYWTEGYSIGFALDECDKFAIKHKGKYFRILVDEGDGRGYVTSNFEGYAKEGDNEIYVIEFKEKKKRNIKIELDDKFYGIILPQDVQLLETEKKDNKKILFVGDEMIFENDGISFADGQSYVSYVNTISTMLGLECINNGIEGAGYVEKPTWTENLADYVGILKRQCDMLNPDIVVMEGGAKDENQDDEQIETNVQECINYTKENSKQLIIMGVWPGIDYIDPGREERLVRYSKINDIIKQKALENKIAFIDLMNGQTISANGDILTDKGGSYLTEENWDKLLTVDNSKEYLSKEAHKYFANELVQEFAKILSKNNKATLSFEVKVKPLEGGVYSKTITNTATVNEDSTNPVDVEVRKTNIEATKTADPGDNTEVKKGSQITYRIEVKNVGNEQETFLVKDKIPEGTSFKEQSIKVKGEPKTDKTEQDLTENGIEVTLNGKETATIEFIVTVTGEGLLNEENIIANSAEVDGKPTNEVKHKFYRRAEINSEKTATIENVEREYAKEGDTIKYEIKVTNDGNIDKIVNIKDEIPDGTEFVENSIKINDELTTLTEEDLTGKGINIDVLPTSEETARKLKIMKNPPIIENLNYLGAEAQNYFSDGKRINAVENGAINDIFTSYNAELFIDWDAVNAHYYNTIGDDDENPIQYSIEFTVDCQEFIFGIKANYFRVYVDEGNGYEMTSYDGREGVYDENYYKMKFATKKQRNIKLELPNKFYGVILHKNDTLTKINRKVNEKVLFIGDGMAYSDPIDKMGYKSYVNVISDILGLEGMNQSADGIGYITDDYGSSYIFKEKLENLVPKLEPNVVILQGGRQDISRGNSVEATMKNAEECIKLLKDTYPDVKVILIGVWTACAPEYTSDLVDKQKELNTQLRKKALENNIPYIDLITGETITGDGKIITKVEPYITTENVNDYVSGSDLTIEGHKCMGEKLAEEVYKILNDIQAEEISPVTLSFEVRVKNLDEGVYSKTITNTATVNGKDTNNVDTDVKKPHIVATKKAEPEGGYVKKGQEITYTIELNNTTGTEGETVLVKDTLPAGVEYKDTTLSIVKDDVEETHEIEDFKTNGIEVIVPAGKKVDVKFKVTVTGEGLENNQEIENTAKVNENPTNSVTHIYQKETEFLNIKVIKKWEDNNNQKGERPQSVKIQLYADGVLTQEEEVTDSTGSNQWEHTFINLDRYSDSGNEINYTVDEESLGDSSYKKTFVTNPLKKTDEGYEATIINTLDLQQETGSLKLTKMGRTKVEAEAGKKGKPLAGVEFRIYRVEDDRTDLTVPEKYANVKEGNDQGPEDDDKWYTKSMVTAEDGILKFDKLPLGRYLVEEVDGPSNIVDKAPNFIVDIPLTEEDSQTLLYDVEVVPKNTVVYGEVVLTKEGANGERLNGVTFKLQRKKDETWVAYPNSKECEIVTEENGTIIVSALPTGTYRFVETDLGENAEQGYILDNKHGYQFTVSMDSNTKETIVEPREIKVVNDKPTVEKTVESYVRNNDNSVEGNQNGNKSFDKGDTLTYKVVVDIPSAIADLNIFKVSDIIDENLQYKEGSLKIKAYKKMENAEDEQIELVETDDYILVEGTEGKVWSVDIKNKGNLTGYYKMEITYEATVLATNETETGYNNNTKLDYSSKVDVDVDGVANQDSPKESECDEVIYTGGFKIEKVGGQNEKLIGAKFKIASSKEDVKNEQFIKNQDGQDIEIISNEIGSAEYWGLSYGTYYLVEIEPPVGYNLLREPVKITVGQDSYKNGNTVVIVNKKGMDLPETGGLGSSTTIIIISGLVLITFGILRYKKNNREL